MESSLQRSDRVLGLLIMVISLILGWGAYGIEFNPNQLTLSARFFPLLLAAILFCLGLALSVKPSPTPLQKTIARLLNPKGLAIGLLLLIYFLSFRFVDFRVGAWLFLLVAMWLLGSRKVWELAVIPVLVALVIYVLFRHGFSVLLPVWG